jgi:hypothetical protein
MRSLDEILRQLKINGFKVNPLKCEWAVKEIDFLGYWLTPPGLKPWTKQIDAILRMDTPKNVKQTRSILGVVTYYRNMWPKCSHILTPLTELTGKDKFVWTNRHQQAFEAMNALMAKDTLLAYPNHNLSFDIYTDASDYQLRTMIMQNGKHVAYYSRKLNSAQRNYTMMEKELLFVVMTLCEFHTMLFGAQLTVYTDHKNVTYHNLNLQRVMRWCNVLEEYSPTFCYIKGPNNVVVDAFLRVPLMPSTEEVNQGPEKLSNHSNKKNWNRSQSSLTIRHYWNVFSIIPPSNKSGSLWTTSGSIITSLTINSYNNYNS